MDKKNKNKTVKTKKVVTIISILIVVSLCIISIVVYKINSERSLKMNIDLSNVDRIRYTKASFLSYDIVDEEDVKAISDMIYNMKGKYTPKDENIDSIPSGLFGLSFYEKDKLVFSCTVISEDAIRVEDKNKTLKRFELDDKLDLNYITKAIEGLEIVK